MRQRNIFVLICCLLISVCFFQDSSYSQDGCCIYSYHFKMGEIDPEFLDDCEYICARSSFCKEYDVCPPPCPKMKQCFAAADVDCVSYFMVPDNGEGCAQMLGTATFDAYLECDESAPRFTACQGEDGKCCVCVPVCSLICGGMNQHELQLAVSDCTNWEAGDEVIHDSFILTCECEQ